MTNFLALLTLGAAIGWFATAVRRNFGDGELLTNIIAAMLGAFSAGLTGNGRTLFSGLTPTGWVAAIAGALAALGLIALARRARPR